MDGYVAKLDRRTGNMLYLTPLGGEGVDIATRVSVGADGAAYVTGFTGSQDFPTTPDALQRVYGGGEQDGFLVAFSPHGKVCYGTYSGGTARYVLEGVAFADNETMVYAAGVVIRPTEPNSPKPDSREKYGSFVVALRINRNCR